MYFHASQPLPCQGYLLSTSLSVSPKLHSTAPALLEYGLDRLSLHHYDKQYEIGRKAHPYQSKQNQLNSEQVDNNIENEISFSPLSDFEHEIDKVIESNDHHHTVTLKLKEYCKNHPIRVTELNVDGKEIDPELKGETYSISPEAEVLTKLEIDSSPKHGKNVDTIIYCDENCVELQSVPKNIDDYIEDDNIVIHSPACVTPKIKCNSQDSNSLFSENESQPRSNNVAGSLMSSSKQEAEGIVDDVLYKGSMRERNPITIELKKMKVDNNAVTSQNESKTNCNIFKDNSVINDAYEDTPGAYISMNHSNVFKCVITRKEDKILQNMNSDLNDEIRTPNDTESPKKYFVKVHEQLDRHCQQNVCNDQVDVHVDNKNVCNHVTTNENIDIHCQELEYVNLADTDTQLQRDDNVLSSFENPHVDGLSAPTNSDQNCNKNEQNSEGKVEAHNQILVKTVDYVSSLQNGNGAIEVDSEDSRKTRNINEETALNITELQTKILSSKNSDFGSYEVSSLKSIVGELSYTPHYTQDCEVLGHHDNITEHNSPLSSMFIKFSPLVSSQTPCTQKAFTEEDFGSKNGRKMQSDQISCLQNKSNLANKILIQDNHGPLDITNYIPDFDNKQSKIDDDEVHVVDKRMNEKCTTLSCHRNVSQFSTNFATENHGTYLNGSTFIVFSPLVESDALSYNNDVKLSPIEHDNIKDITITNQMVPGYETNQTEDNSQTTSINNNADTTPDEKMREIKKSQMFESAISVEKNYLCNSRPEQGLEKERKTDIKDYFECKDDIVENVHVRDSQNDGLVPGELVSGSRSCRDSVAIGTVLENGSGHQQSCDIQYQAADEQIVPENSLVKEHDDCRHEASFFEEECKKVREKEGSIKGSYHSSFQWHSVYESVLMNNNENIQSTKASGDHLESISPLPHLLKRPRPLRVGLSKRQKVNHLHAK